MSLELLELGLNFMGGLLGSSSQKSQQKAQMRQAQKQFDAQMDESVQRRVKDAKQAGVHPLFALGASVGASPTISAQGEQRGNPMQSALTNMAKALGVVEQNRASAKRDEAEAALLDSERKRLEQEISNGSRGLDSVDPPLPEDKPGPPELGPSIITPNLVPAARPADPGTKAGPPAPTHTEYKTPDGQVISVPMDLDEVAQVSYVAQRTPHVLKKWGFKQTFKSLHGRWPTDQEYAKWAEELEAQGSSLYLEKRKMSKGISAELRKAMSGRPIR